MTLRFLSFSVYSVYSVAPHSGLRKDIRTRQWAEVNDPEHWVGESDSVVFAPRKPWALGPPSRRTEFIPFFSYWNGYRIGVHSTSQWNDDFGTLISAKQH